MDDFDEFPRISEEMLEDLERMGLRLYGKDDFLTPDCVILPDDAKSMTCDRCGRKTRAYSAMYRRGKWIFVHCPFCKVGEG